jgi:beta-glucanase (GH16 family)
MRRYRLAAGALAALAVVAGIAAAASSSALSASAPAVVHPKVHTKTRDIHVSAPGTYEIIVTLPATTVTEKVTVEVAGGPGVSGAVLGPGAGDTLSLSEKVKHHTLSVHVLSYGPNVPFKVAEALEPKTTTPPVLTPVGASGTTGVTSPTAPATGSYNTLVWSDEFSGPAGSPPNPANWSFDSGGGCGPGTLSTNTSNVANAQLDGNGHLAITATGPNSNPPYSTAQLDTGGLFSFTYGRIEARIAVASGEGICSAFWLLADDGEQVGWPNGGEIDVMEAIGDLPYQTNGFLHGPVTTNANDQQWNGVVNSVTPLAGTYETYGLIWKPNSLTWTLNGVPFATATPQTLVPTASWVFNGHPFHILLDEAVGGWPGNPNASTVFPAVMSVDWVRVYQ